MSDHLFSNSLLHPFQSVYKPEHSTETILLEIALKQLFRKLSTISYFLLIMETFLLSRSLISPDVILCGWLGSKHQLLNYRSLIFQQRSVELITTVYIVVFEHVFGIHDTALQWFSLYLSSRTQTVSINNLKSDPAPVPYDVPQGSVPGPVLFVLDTTPLSDVIERHSIHHHSFADDTMFGHSINWQSSSSSFLTVSPFCYKIVTFHLPYTYSGTYSITGMPLNPDTLFSKCSIPERLQ